MHELAVCQGLLGEAARIAAEHGTARVTRLFVEIGDLSGVESELLERAFTVARAGTFAEEATLVLVRIRPRVRCTACGAETEVPANALRCGVCGAWRVCVIDGEELILKRIELESALMPSPPEERGMRGAIVATPQTGGTDV
jgi:hydrogenase nickel incorporation protein HypA/HybF